MLKKVFTYRSKSIYNPLKLLSFENVYKYYPQSLKVEKNIRTYLESSNVNGSCSPFHSLYYNHQFIPLAIFKRDFSQIKIYTKTGDKGTSCLYTGERILKSDVIFNALGNIDELSSFIGLAKENALENGHEYVEQLERIQCILQDIGTLVASPVQGREMKDKEMKEKIEKRISFSKRHIKELEAWIDQFTESLPPLTNFILPGGGKISASLHVCRTVCRRAERSLVPLTTQDKIDPNVSIYINRLSDYLFTVARIATIADGKKETIYIRPKPSKESKTKDKAIEEKG